MFLQILDTTLRDGAQGAGVEFSTDDKLRVIEAGMITSPQDAEFFAQLEKMHLDNAKLCVFCRTVKAGESPENDPHLTMSAETHLPAAVIYGKASTVHVAEVLGVSPPYDTRQYSLPQKLRQGGHF